MYRNQESVKSLACFADNVSTVQEFKNIVLKYIYQLRQWYLFNSTETAEQSFFLFHGSVSTFSLFSSHAWWTNQSLDNEELASFWSSIGLEQREDTR